MLIAEFAHTFHKLFCCRIDSALTLDRLKKDRAGIFIDLCFHAGKVIKCRIFYARHQRLKRLSVVRVSGHRQCSDRSSVERMFHRNDLMTRMTVSGISIFFCGFDSSLDRLRAAVGKEHAIHAGCL